MPTLITLALKNWRIVLGAGLALMLVFFIWHYNRTLEQNKALRAQISSVNEQITALNKLSKERQEIDNQSQYLINQIETEASEDDAPTHPVLLNAISRLQ